MFSSKDKFSSEVLSIRVEKIDLDLDDMTLTSCVLSKSTCIPNMTIVT